MGSRVAGTCYFYYSHAVLHKYGWERNALPRSLRRKSPRCQLGANPPTGSNKRWLRIPARPSFCAAQVALCAQRRHYTRFRRIYNENSCYISSGNSARLGTKNLTFAAICGMLAEEKEDGGMDRALCAHSVRARNRGARAVYALQFSLCHGICVPRREPSILGNGVCGRRRGGYWRG